MQPVLLASIIHPFVPFIPLKQIDPTRLISHRMALNDVKHGYEVFSNAAEHKALKVLLVADGE